jgi:hypothetical protein
MYIILEKAKNIERDKETGTAWTWTGTGETLATFTEPDKFIAYVQENAKDLKDVIAFTGSASQLQQANFIIAEELKKVGLLK